MLILCLILAWCSHPASTEEEGTIGDGDRPDDSLPPASSPASGDNITTTTSVPLIPEEEEDGISLPPDDGSRDVEEPVETGTLWLLCR